MAAGPIRSRARWPPPAARHFSSPRWGRGAPVCRPTAKGWGANPVARALAAAGCKTFFVATLDEARAARAAVPSATIYALDGFFQNCGDAYAKIDAKPVFGDLNELDAW